MIEYHMASEHRWL